MLQIDWEANPPVRRFREKRKDQSERESGDDPDREHNERFWKRRTDRRRRFVEDRHIRKCQLAFQLRLFRRPFPGVELVSAEANVALQLAQPVALGLDFDQRPLRSLLLGLERSDLGLRQVDALFQMLAHFPGRLANLLANRGEIGLLGHHLRIVRAENALGGRDLVFVSRELLFQTRENLEIRIRGVVR